MFVRKTRIYTIITCGIRNTSSHDELRALATIDFYASKDPRKYLNKMPLEGVQQPGSKNTSWIKRDLMKLMKIREWQHEQRQKN